MDGDTIFGVGRLAYAQDGYTLDAYETIKTDPSTGQNIYSGRERTVRNHKAAYARRYGLDITEVDEHMLDREGQWQSQRLRDLVLEGSEPDAKEIAIDVYKVGKGVHGRDLVVIRNPKTGKILNKVLNNPNDNAMYYSEWNKKQHSRVTERTPLRDPLADHWSVMLEKEIARPGYLEAIGVEPEQVLAGVGLTSMDQLPDYIERRQNRADEWVNTRWNGITPLEQTGWDPAGKLHRLSPRELREVDRVMGVGEAFNPEGEGFDIRSAVKAGMQRFKHNKHFGSVRQITVKEQVALGLPEDSFLLLKGIKHKSTKEAIEHEKEHFGRKLIKKAGRYWFVPEDYS